MLPGGPGKGGAAKLSGSKLAFHSVAPGFILGISKNFSLVLLTALLRTAAWSRQLKPSSGKRVTQKSKLKEVVGSKQNIANKGSTLEYPYYFLK